MSDEPLEVDPTALRIAANRIDGHAVDFSSDHQRAHSGASQAVLGSGLAGAALTEMLAAWEAEGTRFGKHFVKHAEGHREAANSYERTDGDNAFGINTADSEL